MAATDSTPKFPGAKLTLHPSGTTIDALNANGFNITSLSGKQTVILPLMGKLTMDVQEVELAPNSTPVLVGKQPLDLGAIAIPIPQRERACCACGR